MIYLALAIQIAWLDLPEPARKLASEIAGASSFASRIPAIRTQNLARLRQGEIDHLIFYMLYSSDFTKEPPGKNVDVRLASLLAAFQRPADQRQRYLATLLPSHSPETFLRNELDRVRQWILQKEIGCQTAPSPQACVAALYTNRGHSSDTDLSSMVAVEAAFERLGRRDFKRVLIIGPGSDFAPRTGSRSGPPRTYQPELMRAMLSNGAVIDCADINPRVLATVDGQCSNTEQLDIAVERSERKYDAIVATNVLLYLDASALLLALNNIRSMLEPGGVFIHNDGRFEANLFGKANGLPVIHFGSVDLDKDKRLVDRYVIHSPAEPKL